jgi:hypothetical protein
VADHFGDVGKMVTVGSGAYRKIDDIMLTRYACHLIAQNGDPDVFVNRTRFPQRLAPVGL